MANVHKRESTWTDRAKRNHFLLHSVRFTRNRNVTVSTDYEGCGDIRGPQPGPKLKYKVSDSRFGAHVRVSGWFVRSIGKTVVS